MKKKLISIFLAICMVLTVCPFLGYAASVPTGAGTAADPYQIGTAEELIWFAGVVNGTLTDGTAQNTAACAKLTADIDLTGATWSGIGNASNTFSGTFDGGGFAISNMNSAKTNVSPGLIYALGTNGVVKKLTMKSAFTFDQNGQNKGIVVGANSGNIEEVFVTDSQIKMGNYDGMGGIAGKNTGTISNCGAVNVTITRVWGAVAGNKTAGAITENNTGAVSNCYSYGITFAGGTEANAGALVATGTAPVNSYYLSTDISTEKKVAAGVGGTAKTAAQFASGEVCWLLNGSVSTGVWKQDVDADDTPDASPNFTGTAVYYGYNDYDANGFVATLATAYSNVVLEMSEYQPATLNNNGTAADATDDCYEIANAGQLYWFAAKANATPGGSGLNGKLTADITVNTGNLSGCGGTNADDWWDWTPINQYSCTFDGNGKTISGLYLSVNTGSVGLFGVAMSGTVKDLTLTNSYINGGDKTGNTIAGICGENRGTIQNCVNEATVCGTNINTVGGICGDNRGTVQNCYNSGTVSGDSGVGGICGNNIGTVQNCYNSGTVSGDTGVGGICGNNRGTVQNCYNSGTVSGDSGVGGICGHKFSGTLQNCYNTGAVSGTCYIGGIAGYNSGTVTNAYYLEGCAKDGDGTVQYGIGNKTQGSTTADTVGSTTYKTTAQFASGEVCWLLNGSVSTGVWKQDLDVDDTPDASPNFTGATVYYAESLKKYTNSEIVSVDITWGAMEFTYSDGTWNAATHQYDGAGWTAAEGGNAVTVKNSGTVNISATLSYKPMTTFTATIGSFDSDVTAAISVNEEKKWLLSLSGAPSGIINKATLGTVTVTIGGE